MHKLKTCPICKNKFNLNHNNSKFCSKECINLRSKQWYEMNKKRIKNNRKIYLKKNKDKIKKQQYIYWQIYKEQHKDQLKKYRQEHKEKIRKCSKEHFQKYKIKILKQRRERRKTDLCYRTMDILRHRIWTALKGISKSKSTTKLIGCSIKKLKNYLESKFKQGMSWKNYGKWHIDHIRPCCSFNLRKKSEQKKCFHYTNLQPLWAEENWRKNKNVAI